jgi:molecular chaperone DnaK
MSKQYILGIDLGTGNSAMSIMEADKVTIIPNAEGQFTTPSIVSFSKNGDILVGQAAKRQATVNASRTINSIKRFMGRKWDEVQDEIKNIAYEVVNSNGNIRVKIDDKEYSPEQISAMILGKLKKDAEAYLGQEVKDVIITCPAYFDSAAKEATKNAGIIAGFNVLRIISEPTSACLSYGLSKKKSGVIAVVDIGCGTSDLSIIDVADGVFEVKATNGDNHLGGWDIDNTIAKWIIDEFKKSDGIDLSKDNMALQRVNDEAEKAKIELSTTQNYDINIPFITADANGPRHLNMSLSRAKFEQLIEPLIERLREPVRQCLRDSDVDKVDEVILVGGSTRVPLIQAKVKDFYGMEPSKNANPDFVVAEGAAIQGSVLAGETTDILLLDTTPLNLGIETVGGVLTTLIEKNTTIPVEKSEIFSTATDNQSGVTVVVFQGNRPMARDNKLLGQFNLDNIPPAPRGVPQIEVKFSIDASNILTVTAKDLGTSKDAHITISSSSGLSKEEIEKAKQEAEMYAEEDKKKSELILEKNSAEALCFNLEKQLDTNKDVIDDELAISVTEKIKSVRETLATDDIEKIKAESKELSNLAMKIGEKIYAKNQTANGEGTSSFPPGFDPSMFANMGAKPNTETTASSNEGPTVVDAEVVD